MNTKHVLNEQLMMGYAAGILPQAFELVVATKMSMCDESRAMVGTYEAIGGCLMEQCRVAELSATAFASTMSMIKNKKVEPKKQLKCSGIFPKPLQDFVGGGAEAVKWKSLGGGVKQAILPTDNDASARLLYIPAGTAVPDHGHRGTELTLVLQGSFSDEVDTFERGDIEIANEDLNHQPIAGSDCDCICLAATDAPLRFNSLIPRMLQPFFKI